MYRLPSVEPPFMATKTAPCLMRRESYSTPVMGCAESPEAPTPVISAISSFQSMSEIDCSLTDPATMRDSRHSARAAHHDPRVGANDGTRGGSLFANRAASGNVDFQARHRCGFDDLAHGETN